MEFDQNGVSGYGVVLFGLDGPVYKHTTPSMRPFFAVRTQ